MKNILDKMISLCKENKKYIATAALLFCFVVILIFFTGERFNHDRIEKENEKEISGQEYNPATEFEIDAYAEVNELINEYFSAYVAADFETLEMLVSPLTEMEKSYITTMSPFYEEYRNITCYTKHGLSKNSYIVSVCFDVKFADIEVTAPSMFLFYVQTAEDGSLYINNRYSDFNLMYKEIELDKDVYTAMYKYTSQDDYVELKNQVEREYQELIKEDNEIFQLTKRTIPAVRQAWEDTVYYSGAGEDTQETESTDIPQETDTSTEPDVPQEPDTPAEPNVPAEPDTSAEPDVPQEPDTPAEPVVQRVRIVNVTGCVNIRANADAASADIGDAFLGDIFLMLGAENDANGEAWTKVQMADGSIGYIKSVYLEVIG